MRTFGVEDVEDIRNAPRSLTLVEYMALADVEYHMREKKITTRGHQLKMFELIKKAVAAYRGHRSCPWYEITFNRRDGKIWDPTKIPNRAAAFEDMVRREQDAGRVVYLVPQQEPEKPPVDADDATVVDPKQISALALALQRIPEANVSWAESGMLKHKHSDIGVAVALPGGLITPIIHKAETLSLSAISNAMRDLAVRARARKLKPHEYQGGTSSVSNLGMYGIKDFTAVINPPQSSILAIGAGEERAVVRNGQIVPATIMSCTLSCDHRAIDGALGAELITAFKTLIENPVMMVV